MHTSCRRQNPSKAHLVHVFYWSVWNRYWVSILVICLKYVLDGNIHLIVCLFVCLVQIEQIWRDLGSMLVVLLLVGWMILLDLLVIGRLFWVLLIILYIRFLLLLYEFEPEYCALLVDILLLYWYMLVVFLCLFVCRLSILCLCGSFLHRNFHSYLGMTVISHIRCVYWSIFLVSSLACLWLSWEMMWAFSVSFFQSIQLWFPDFSW